MGKDKNMSSKAFEKKQKKNELDKSQKLLGESSASVNAAQSSCTWPSCSMSFPNISERDRHYVTIHSNNAERPHRCEVVSCPAGVTSWARADKLKLHNKIWHGPYHCKYPGCSRGFPNGLASQAELNIHNESLHSIGPGSRGPTSVGDSSAQEFSSCEPTEQSSTSYGSVLSMSNSYLSSPQTIELSSQHATCKKNSSDPTTKSASYANLSPPWPPVDIPNISSLRIAQHIHPQSEILDQKYKIHRSSEFKFGRVFKVLWSEPLGTSSKTSDFSDFSDVTVKMFGEKAYCEIRRFVIIKPSQGHCLCLPIHTYQKRGVLKRGVKAPDHAIIYTGKSPVAFKGEREMGLNKRPIRVKPNTSRDKLDWASRLNYSKVYTVEHNVKVQFIGQIHSESESHFIEDYNTTNALFELHSGLDATNIKERASILAPPSHSTSPYASSPQESQTPTSSTRSFLDNLSAGSRSISSLPSFNDEPRFTNSQQYLSPDAIMTYVPDFQDLQGLTASSKGLLYSSSRQEPTENSVTTKDDTGDQEEFLEYDEGLYSAD